MSSSKLLRGALAPLLLGMLALGLAGCEKPTSTSPIRRFIVGLREGNSPDAVAAEQAQQPDVGVSWVFDKVLRGFALSMPEDRVGALAADPRVAFVEDDQEVHTLGQVVPTGVARAGAPANPVLAINGVDDTRVDVDVAIVDSGVSRHPDLNVYKAVDCAGFFATCSAGGDDGNGHGTHVAGTVAALDNGSGVVGMAPGARLWAVKALNALGSGSMSNIIAGLNYVAANAGEIEVANLSFGCKCASTALAQAIDGVLDKGVVVVVAAGNSNADTASGYFPGSIPDVVTVSALSDYDGKPGGLGVAGCRPGGDDVLADFSNFGAPVDIVAPGVCITSTAPGGGLAVMSGTSMAAPHVTGAAALLASRNRPRNRAGVLDLANRLKAAGTQDWTDTSGDGRKEPALYVANTAAFNPLMVGSATPDPDPTPTPVISASGSGSLLFGIFRSATITWSGATGASVDLYRDGTKTITANDGSQNEFVGFGGGGSVTYKVCQLGTQTCSPTVTISF